MKALKPIQHIRILDVETAIVIVSRHVPVSHNFHDHHYQQFEHGTLDRGRDDVPGLPVFAERLDCVEFSSRDQDRAQVDPVHCTLRRELREPGTIIRVPTRRVVPSGPECDVSNGRKKGAKAKSAAGGTGE